MREIRKMATRNTGRENVTTPALKRFKLQPNRNYVGFALLQTTRDFLKALAILATCFRVDTNSFVAGALAVTSAFFVVFSEPIKLFFSIVINHSSNYGLIVPRLSTLRIFRVDAPSFLAGAAVSSGFFVADGLAVTIFFFLQGTRENVRWCAAFGKKACSQQLGPSVPKQYDR
jgi:hypothetical protein